MGTYKSEVKFNFTGLIKEENNIFKTDVSLVNAQISVSFILLTIPIIY